MPYSAPQRVRVLIRGFGQGFTCVQYYTVHTNTVHNTNRESSGQSKHDWQLKYAQTHAVFCSFSDK